jgi:RNA polymerase sigma-70 factor (ECF subfamily)
VLREVFGFDYGDIADAVGKPVPAVRQIAHRAREHIQARRRRFAPVDPQQNARVAAEFMAAASSGDVSTVISMLAPEVVWTADGGGKATAARRPVIGAEKVAAVAVGLMRVAGRMTDVRVEWVVCNSAPAVLLYRADHLEGVFTMEVVDGKIANVYVTRNPDKLVTAATARAISRS